MPTDLSSVIVAAGAAFGVALGTLWLARRAGITDVQRALRTESVLLVETLKARLDLVEEENRLLKNEIALLERRYARLEADYEDMRQRLARVEDADA